MKMQNELHRIATDAHSGMADLFIVGIGIHPLNQASLEACRILSLSKKVLTIFPTPGVARFAEHFGLEIVNLAELYQIGRLRAEIYERIAESVIREARAHRPISYLTYGHPLVLDEPSKLILDLADRENIDSRIIPGISFIDHLIANLRYSITSSGYDVMDAKHVLRYINDLKPERPLLICQLGAVTDFADGDKPPKPSDFEDLARALGKLYGGHHEMILCDLDVDAQAPIFLPIAIRELPIAAEGITYATTAFVPPRSG